MPSVLLKALESMYPNMVVSTTEDPDSIDHVEATTPSVPSSWISEMREWPAGKRNAMLKVWGEFYAKYGKSDRLRNIRRFMSRIDGLAVLTVREEEGHFSYLCYLKKENGKGDLADDWIVFMKGPQPATADQVAMADVNLAVVLPRSYKDFLLIHNGILWRDDIFSAGILGVSPKFRGLYPQYPERDIVAARSHFRDMVIEISGVVPEDTSEIDKVIPFECDVTGDYSCFHTDWETGPDELGCVHYFHEMNDIGVLEPNYNELSFPHFWQWLDWWFGDKSAAERELLREWT